MTRQRPPSGEAEAIAAEFKRLQEKIEILGQINIDLYQKYMKVSNDLKWYEENSKVRLMEKC